MENEKRPVIVWNKNKLARFKEAYAAAGEVFEFEGNEFLKAYAKYLIQYLEGKLGKV